MVYSNVSAVPLHGYVCFRFDHEVRKSFSIHPKDISRKNEWFSAGPAVVGPPELIGIGGTVPHQVSADIFKPYSIQKVGADYA